MKLRKILSLAVLGLFIFSGFAFALPVEDALSPQPDDSVYVVLKLSNTGNLLRWALSQENIDAFMPVILASELSNEIIGGLEIARAVIDKLPLESLAITAGSTKSGMPFMQAAFTVNSALAPTVRKIAAGSADAKDVAKLILGNDNPFANIAESMIKVERDGDKYMVNNELVLKSEGDLLLLALSPEEANNSIEALKNPAARLFSNVARRFDTEDFVFVHIDHETAKKLDDSKELDDVKLEKYLDKPLNVELAFRRTPDKFVTALGVNLREALKPKYVERYFKASELVTTKGGYIDLNNAGGSKSPLFAFGGLFNATGMTETKELKSIWDGALKQLKRFKVTEQELFDVLNGSVSLVINDSLTVEGGIKLPAIFASATGKNGAAEKIFAKLAGSQHFSKREENILQVDSSLSPVSCLITNNKDTLGINMAEITSFADRPQPSGALADLMKRDAVSALVIDFAGIQSWLVDNGVLTILVPMAGMLGYGKYAEYAREILNAKFSVPSFALWAESPEVVYTEFAIEDVKTEDGILIRIARIARDYMPKPKSETK